MSKCQDFFYSFLLCRDNFAAPRIYVAEATTYSLSSARTEQTQSIIKVSTLLHDRFAKFPIRCYYTSLLCATPICIGGQLQQQDLSPRYVRCYTLRIRRNRSEVSRAEMDDIKRWNFIRPQNCGSTNFYMEMARVVSR